MNDILCPFCGELHQKLKDHNIWAACYVYNIWIRYDFYSQEIRYFYYVANEELNFTIAFFPNKKECELYYHAYEHSIIQNLDDVINNIKRDGENYFKKILLLQG